LNQRPSLPFVYYKDALLGLTAGQVFALTHVDFSGYGPGLGGLILVLGTTLFVAYRLLKHRFTR